MFKKILIGLLILVVVIIAIVAIQPSEFRISRSATIAASPDTLFAQVNDFRNWNAWSPWAKMDPNAKNTFEGPASGPGAIFRWSGNNQVGEGSMTIVESRPSELIQIQLDFLKPFKATSMGEFTFKPEGNQTVVTWSMAGRNGFMGKACSLVMNCDKMVGGEFEKGLANIKSIVEAPGAK
jgi:hypothetical protein